MASTIQLLTALSTNKEARDTMIEASIIIPILTFLNSTNKVIQSLWYLALKEFGAFDAFRR